MAVPVVSDAAEMFRQVDGGAMVGLMARLGVERCQVAKLDEARNVIQQKTVQALKEFRATAGRQAQTFNRLIFPESMRLLPLYTLAMMKCGALRGGPQDVTLDERCSLIFDIMGMPTSELLTFLYPSLFALHNMPPDAGTPANGGPGVLLPQPVPLSGEYIDSRGAFLLDNGRTLLLWLGKSLPPEFLTDVFGVGELPQSAATLQLRPSDTELSTKINGIIATLKASHVMEQQLVVVAQGQREEALLFPYLVEDRGSSMSYSDFLLSLHRQVQSAKSPAK